MSCSRQLGMSPHGSPSSAAKSPVAASLRSSSRRSSLRQLHAIGPHNAGAFQALALIVYPQRFLEAFVLKQTPDRDGFELLVIVIRRNVFDDAEKLGPDKHRHAGDALPLLLGNGLSIFNDFKKGSAFGHRPQRPAELSGFAHVVALVGASEPRALPAFSFPRLAFGRQLNREFAEVFRPPAAKQHGIQVAGSSPNPHIGILMIVERSPLGRLAVGWLVVEPPNPNWFPMVPILGLDHMPRGQNQVVGYRIAGADAARHLAFARRGHKDGDDQILVHGTLQ